MDENHPKAPAALKLQNKRTFASSHNIYKIGAIERTKDCRSLHAQQVCLPTVHAASNITLQRSLLVGENYWQNTLDKEKCMETIPKTELPPNKFVEHPLKYTFLLLPNWEEGREGNHK